VLGKVERERRVERESEGERVRALGPI